MLQYNADEHKLNEKVDLSASALVYGDIIISLIKYSDDSIIICGEKSKSALILSIPSMHKIKSLSINTKVTFDGFQMRVNIDTGVLEKFNPQLCYPLVHAHIVPDTDNRFMLEFDESKFIFLRTIETGARQVLIHGSPNCPAKTRCAFFLKN